MRFSGAYGDKPLNVEENIWKRVLKGLEQGYHLQLEGPVPSANT